MNYYCVEFVYSFCTPHQKYLSAWTLQAFSVGTLMLVHERYALCCHVILLLSLFIYSTACDTLVTIITVKYLIQTKLCSLFSLSVYTRFSQYLNSKAIVRKTNNYLESHDLCGYCIFCVLIARLDLQFRIQFQTVDCSHISKFRFVLCLVLTQENFFFAYKLN